MEKTRTMRQATAKDAPKVASFLQRTRPQSQIPIACRKAQTKDIRAMQKNGQFLLVNHVDGPLAGAIYVTTRNGRGYLDLLSVAMSMSEAGLEKRLLTIAEMMCKANGCREMEIRVNKSEMSLLFHELGYRYASDDSMDHRAIRMVKSFASILH